MDNRTSIAGAIGAIGLALTQVPHPQAQLAGAVLAGLGQALVGYWAKDRAPAPIVDHSINR